MTQKRSTPAPTSEPLFVSGEAPRNHTTQHLDTKERAALELLMKRPMDRFELGRKIRCGYVPNIIKSLRDKGILIDTVMVSVRNSEFDDTRKGIYHLRADDKLRRLLRKESEI